MKFKNITLPKALPYVLIVIGVLGYALSFIIMQEKIHLGTDPNYIPSCNLNPVISCGSIMKSVQSHAFGFPNPYIGLGAYPVVAAVGIALLAGARFKRWYWLWFNAGFLFALAFVHWLAFQSVFRINALCPFCIGVWVTSITGFWYVTLYNIDQGHLKIPAKAQKGYAWVRRHHLDILILWFLIIGAAILHHFWYYYGKHLPF